MTDPSIRLLTPEDLDAALQLSSTAGWNQRRDDWRTLLAIAPAGTFAAVVDGRIAGTAIGIDYGGFGWIAMMLVDPAYRGRGLGGRLLQAAMEAIPSDRPVRLDATPLGRPLYQRYGFVDEEGLTRCVADPSQRSGRFEDTADRVTADDLPRILDRDQAIFGGQRKAVLEWSLKDAPYARIVRAGDAIRGYSFGRRGRLFDEVGPIVAEDAATARALVSSAITAAGDRSVVVDAFDANDSFAEWLRASGFRPERPLFRMCRPAAHGVAPIRARSEMREFAIFGPEFG